jgi:hypothetical protein
MKCPVLVALCTALVISAASPTTAAAFEVAVQDNDVVLDESGMTRAEFVRGVRRDLGATAVQVDVLWGHWRAYGPAKYDAAVDELTRGGMAVRLRLVPTPRFSGAQPGLPTPARPYGQDGLSATNPDPALMRAFAGEIAARYRGRVSRFIVGLEPNHPDFSDSTTPETYRPLYLAAFAAIRAAQPAARVLTAGLCPYHRRSDGDRRPDRWYARLRALGPLPTSGITSHAYQDRRVDPLGAAPRYRDAWTISNTSHAVARSRSLFGAPYYISEYASTHERNRMANTRRAIRQARRSGARGIAIYQYIANSARAWNTGLRPPTRAFSARVPAPPVTSPEPAAAGASEQSTTS